MYGMERFHKAGKEEMIGEKPSERSQEKAKEGSFKEREGTIIKAFSLSFCVLSLSRVLNRS